MSVDRKDEGFLDRWSKRKKAVEQEELEAETPEDAAESAEREPETEEEALDVLRERDPELAEQVSAIDIEALTYEDDFSVFMNKKVPEFIRRKALSKLWLSSPILANVDGLNDYDEDFRDAGSIIEAVQTALSKDEESPENNADGSKEAVAQADAETAERGCAPADVSDEDDVAETDVEPASDDPESGERPV